MVSAEPFSQMHARNRIGMRGYSAAEVSDDVWKLNLITT